MQTEKDVSKELLEAKNLLSEALDYINNTHGYDTELFSEIKEFLNKNKEKKEYNPLF